MRRLGIAAPVVFLTIPFWGVALDACAAQPPTASDATQVLARGAINYVSFCAGCHGVNAEGNSAQGAPLMAGQPAAALARQIAALSTNDRRGEFDHTALLTQFSARDLNGIASYVSMLTAPPASAVN